MNEKTFIKTLNKYLYRLNKKTREEELNKFRNLDNYDLDPIAIANSIYEERGINFKINNNIKLFDAAYIIIDKLKSKDKEVLKNILLFFLYLVILLIVIKIPFIYVRDMISTLFYSSFVNDNAYTIWALIIEFSYAATTIYIFIKLIKKKALEIEKKS